MSKLAGCISPETCQRKKRNFVHTGERTAFSGRSKEKNRRKKKKILPLLTPSPVLPSVRVVRHGAAGFVTESFGVGCTFHDKTHRRIIEEERGVVPSLP